jgi:hypothetical protein
VPAATPFAHFLVVEADNGVSLDFAETTGAITPRHYAFLVGEEEFDAAFARIRGKDLPYWADPGQAQPGMINHRDGGRGLYFEDPDGHLLEIITRPYGSSSRPFACLARPCRQNLEPQPPTDSRQIRMAAAHATCDTGERSRKCGKSTR